MDPMIQKLQQLARQQQFEAQSDAELLERFHGQGDQAAFAELLRRHAKMVLACCRRWLPHEPEAEDACQATFLILAKKAGNVAWAESISGWLHRVAVLISRKQALAARKRRERERSVAKPEQCREPAHDARELPRILDEALLSLPQKFRAPIVLCCLEELSYIDAAQRLGLSEGALRSRLFRAREALRDTLHRRGIELATVLVLIGLAAPSVAAGLPASKLASTLSAASVLLSGTPPTGLLSPNVLQLLTGGLHMLTMAKLKSLATSLILGAALLGGSLWSTQWVLSQSAPPEKSSAATTNDVKNKPNAQADARKSRRYKDPTHFGLHGELRQLDPVARRVTLQLQGQQVPLKLELAANCTATICDEPGQLTDLQKGQGVVLQMSDDHQRVINIATWSEDDIDAILTELRLDDRKLTVQHDGNSKTYPVKSDAIIAVDGFLTRLDSLDVGMRLELWFSRDRKSITRILSSCHKPGDSVGQFVSVDLQASKLTTKQPEVGEQVRHEFAISPKTRLIINGKAGQLSDFKAPMFVRVRPITPIQGHHTHIFAWTDDE